jgi:hypothetical protein
VLAAEAPDRAMRPRLVISRATGSTGFGMFASIVLFVRDIAIHDPTGVKVRLSGSLSRTERLAVYHHGGRPLDAS